MRTGKNTDKLTAVFEALCKAQAVAHEWESEKEGEIWDRIADLLVSLEEYLYEKPQPEEEEKTETIKKLLEELAAGKCPGVKGATAYKIQKFAAERGYV